MDPKPLTWNDLANEYDKVHLGSARPARTMKMETVFDWAERQTKLFYLKDDYLYKRTDTEETK